MYNCLPTSRRILRPQDVMNYYGIGRRQAQRLMADVRLENGRKQRSKIPIIEFCKYYQIPEEDFRKSMQ